MRPFIIPSGLWRDDRWELLRRYRGLFIGSLVVLYPVVYAFPTPTKEGIVHPDTLGSPSKAL